MAGIDVSQLIVAGIATAIYACAVLTLTRTRTRRRRRTARFEVRCVRTLYDGILEGRVRSLVDAMEICRLFCLPPVRDESDFRVSGIILKALLRHHHRVLREIKQGIDTTLSGTQAIGAVLSRLFEESLADTCSAPREDPKIGPVARILITAYVEKRLQWPQPAQRRIATWAWKAASGAGCFAIVWLALMLWQA